MRRRCDQIATLTHVCIAISLVIVSISIDTGYLTVACGNSTARLYAENVLVPSFSVQWKANPNHARVGIHH